MVSTKDSEVLLTKAPKASSIEAHAKRNIPLKTTLTQEKSRIKDKN